MTNIHVVTFTPEDFRELLGVDDERIIRVDVSYSPMMDEWSLIVELTDESAS